MALRDDLIAYRASWQAVAEVKRLELQRASVGLRWQQLNSIVGLAIALGILRTDPSEEKVYSIWAKLKEKLAQNSPQQS
jgi:hypothetical protein